MESFDTVDIKAKFTQKDLTSLIESIVEPFYDEILGDKNVSVFIPDGYLITLKIKQASFVISFFVQNFNAIQARIERSSKMHKDINMNLNHFTPYMYLWAKLVHGYIKECLKPSEEDMLKWEIKLQRVINLMLETFFKAEKPILKKTYMEEKIDKMHYEEHLKISAVDFLAEYDMPAETIDEMIELNRESKQKINERETLDEETMDSMCTFFASYSSLLNGTYEFRDLGFTFSTVSSMIVTNKKSIGEKNGQKIKRMVELVIEDMESWVKNIFIEKSAIDIHYLDASLLSSIAQIEMAISDDGSSGKDMPDLELF